MYSPRIAIIGAGIGGLTCAAALQRRGHQVVVHERDTARNARSQGGMLDLHTDTGQAALRAVDLFDAFETLSRPEGQELRGLDPITAALVHHEVPEGADAPEIDRGHLRALLFDSLEPDTVQWGRKLRRVDRSADGTPQLYFADGTTDRADLVIGADGAWSRTRPALSAATPAYTGDVIIETHLDEVETRHPGIARMVGPGTMAAKSGRTMLSAQRNAGEHIRVYVALTVPSNWDTAAGVDFTDPETVRAHLLTVLDGWHCDLLRLVRDPDGPFIHRPLYVLPVGHSWEHVPGVTLLGDAAHLMPPYGIGANLAMIDGTDLADAIDAHPDLDMAVRAYEARMLPRAEAAARACAGLATTMGDDVVKVTDAREQLNRQIRESSV